MPVVVALPELLALAALIVAYGLIVFGSAFVAALFQVVNTAVGWVPWLGGKAKAPLHSIEKRLNSAMSSAASGVEYAIGKSWHVLAVVIEDTASALVEAVRATAHVAWLVEVKYPLAALQAAVHLAGRGVRVVEHTATTVVHDVKVSRKVLEALVAKAVAAAVHTKHLVITTYHEVHTVPAKIGYTWKQIRTLKARLSRFEKATIGLGAVALVGTALGRMGLGWLRCPSLSRLGKSIGCGGFAALEELFAPAVEALVVLDLCNFALAAQKLAREFVPALGVVLLTADAICLGGGASLPSAHDPTTISGRITLPSASD